MKSWMNVSVLLVIILSTKEVRGALGLYPERVEAVYSYNAEVSIETQLPVSLISRFKLMGDLHVYGLEQHVTIQLHNLKYLMYSGKNNKQDHNISLTDLPISAAEVFEPFDIHYNHGKVDNISINSGEASWSKSVKQAIAGILQLDMKEINVNERKSFSSTEQSLYGECGISYIVEPFENGAKVTKLFSLFDCDSELIDWSNVELTTSCPHSKLLNYELLTSNERVYRVVKQGEDQLLIKEVLTQGKTFTLVNNNIAGRLMISVSQNMTLQALNEDFKLPKMVNPKEIKSLAYDTSEFYSFKFSTNEDLTGLVNKVLGLLSVIVAQLEAPDQLSSEHTNPQQSILIPLLITHLRKLDLNLLDNVFAQLKQSSSQTVRELFIKSLPLVGSKDSSIYILNLIKKKEVNDNDACALLFSLSHNIRQTSEDSLLKDYEELVKLPDYISQSVKNSALLSFATLIHKTCKNKKCKSDTEDKYTTSFLQVLKDKTIDRATKELYLSALHNIQSRKVLVYLKQLIYENVNIEKENQHIQELAMRAIYPIVSKKPDEVFEVYWPILSNCNNSLEVRSCALRLMMESGPNMSNLLRLHVFMSREEGSDLFNIYYSIMKSYGGEENDCFYKRSENARRILRIISVPNYSSTMSAYFKYMIGQDEVEVSTLANPQTGSTSSVEVRLTSQTAGYRVQYLTICLKIIGYEGGLLKHLVKNIKSLSEESLQQLQNHLKQTEIRLVAYSQTKIILLKWYNGTTFRHLITDMTNIFGWRENQLHITSDFSMERFFVTDLGMPGVLSADFPLLSKLNWNFKAVDNNLMNLNVYLRKWMQGSSVFKVKNTVVNIWQGVVKTHITRFNLPLSSSLRTNPQYDFNLTLAKPKGAGGGEVGFKWHTKTDVFTVTYNNNYDALTYSCPSCSSLITVTNQRTSIEHLSNVMSDGYSFKSSIFDCEDDESTHNIVRPLLSSLENTSLHPFEVLLTGGRSLEAILNALPICGSCGYAAVININEEIKKCVNVKHKASLSDVFKWSDAKYHNQFDILFGSSSSINKDCTFNDYQIYFLLQEETVKVPENVCYIDKCDVKETSREECQLCTSEHTSSSCGNRRVILSINGTKLPQNIEMMLHNVVAILKNLSPKYFEEKSTLKSGEAIIKIMFNNQDSEFSLDMAHSSAHTVFKDLQFHKFNSNLLMFKHAVEILCR